MKLELHQGLKSSPESTTLILFVTQVKSKSKDQVQPLCHNMPTEMRALFLESVAEKIVSGSPGETTFLRNNPYFNFKHVLFVGLGAWDSHDHEALRIAGGAIEASLSSHKIYNANINLETLGDAISAAHIQALAEGLGLASYRFEELMTPKKEKVKVAKVILSLHQVTKAHKDAFEAALIVVDSVCFSRRLGDLPGNLMTPAILANEAVKAAKGTKIKVTVWDKARIRKERMGGLLCVSRGSDEEPRFIRMDYQGGKATQKPIVLVGKGLTFDTGGLSIKPSAGMEEMKYDMCGGANVIGTMLAIAKLKLKVNVIGLIPASENLSGGSAVKPGDIYRGRNGKSYEVNNTDAEGRLILSDALCIASEIKPRLVIDIATLTGAMVVALGNTHTGFYTKNSELKTQIDDAARASGELVWHMPLCDFHTKDIKGTFADLSNLAATRAAGSATAAAFLEQFVEADIPWAHFDIAGTGWATGGRFNYNPKKGASGVMIRTFVELARLCE